MCGIVGYVGGRNAIPILVDGLRRLEYRGYDSAGIGMVQADRLRIIKCQGPVQELERRLPKNLKSSIAIAHTRWATHGNPSDRNAHPHADMENRIAVVHNGIIENASALRARLQSTGVVFRSDTDSEVLAHLIATMSVKPLAEAVRAALRLVAGTYGLIVIDAAHPESFIAARNGSPVLLGLGEGEMYVASDIGALTRHTNHIVHLDDGELATVRADGFEASTLEGTTVSKPRATVAWTNEAYEKGNFTHYMQKEMIEQPEALQRLLAGRLDARFKTTRFGGLESATRELREIQRVKILGCGSAYLAGCYGAQLIEQLARIPAHAEPASEFRYRNPVIERDTLYIGISQSGETFDTIAAIQEVKRKGGQILGIVNVVGSSLASECGRGIYLHAGPEIAVVATKSFTSMTVALTLLAIHLGRIRDLSLAQGARLLDGLLKLPSQIQNIIARDDEIARLAKRFASSDHAYFIGRATSYTIAAEGALKLKEVSYLHAEAYPASELKHGPLALISESVPTVVVMPHDELLQKNLSTIEEIRARRGPVIAITNDANDLSSADEVFAVPACEPELDPILLNIPLQLLAYHVALQRGLNIDQPRNLAKSVTVE
jgi:glucosamine--fructose-6-phosphate aminotransferase (isomerizing)